MNPDHPVARWHRIVEQRDAAGLASLIDDEAVFVSPVVHTPQRGKPLTLAYLGAALRVFGNESFHYVRQIVGEHDAMLEFETTIDGTLVNGVDILHWNEAGHVTEFKVMLRPLKAINLIHERMGALLQAMQQRHQQQQ